MYRRITRRITTDQSIRVTGTFAEARSMAAWKDRCDALENIKARHNTLGETIVGLRNIVMAIHTSQLMYTAQGNPNFFFAMTARRLQHKPIGLFRVQLHQHAA
jgi:hypothetical protein